MLVTLGVHTGLRLGVGLNFVLGLVCLAVFATGGAVGGLAGIEGRTRNRLSLMARRWRPVVTKLHLLLLWPLPALVAVHIATFYWFSD